MNRFIKSIVIFCFLIGTYCSINLLINIHRLSDPVILTGRTLIMGDSHLRTSVDPEILPSSSNVCSGAESYIMTYYKLIKLLNDNPQINRVFLAFSYNNFSAYQDLRLIGSQSKSQFIRYYEILPIDFPNKLDVNKSKFYNTYISELALYPNFFESKYLGGFKRHEPGLQRADLMETINKHYYPEGDFVGISKYAEPYLDSIIQLTKRKKIQLNLLAAPLHSAYRDKVPEEIKDYFQEVKSKLKEEQISVLDFIDEPFADSLFKDYDHLSYEGSQLFTKYLSDKKSPADTLQQGN